MLCAQRTVAKSVAQPISVHRCSLMAQARPMPSLQRTTLALGKSEGEFYKSRLSAGRGPRLLRQRRGQNGVPACCMVAAPALNGMSSPGGGAAPQLIHNHQRRGGGALQRNVE